jgi:hypothetical protein
VSGGGPACFSGGLTLGNPRIGAFVFLKALASLTGSGASALEAAPPVLAVLFTLATYVLVLEGTLKLTIGGTPVQAPAGSVVRMPANVPHAVESPGRSKMMLVMLRGGTA